MDASSPSSSNVGKVMSMITKFAKGRNCTIRLPNICNHDPETSVMTHVPSGIRFGKGIGYKPSDLLVAIGCSECHAHTDGRIKSNFDRDFLMLCWWEGHGETMIILEREGIIAVK